MAMRTTLLTFLHFNLSGLTIRPITTLITSLGATLKIKMQIASKISINTETQIERQHKGCVRDVLKFFLLSHLWNL